MRSRWYHKPILHLGHRPQAKKPSWLELFYDLIFVASFIRLGIGLSENVSVEGFVAFGAIFTTLWVAWTGLTLYVNRFEVDDFIHRGLVFVQMFAVAAMALFASEVLAGSYRDFSFANGAAQLVVALLYARSWKQEKHCRNYSLYWGGVFAFGGFSWVASALVPWPYQFPLWLVGTSAILLSPWNRISRSLTERFPVDHSHLAQRYGFLTLAILGVSFFELLSGLHRSHVGFSLLGQISFILLITYCVWWIYFDDVAGANLKDQKLTPMVWLYGHLPMQVGVTLVGVALKAALSIDLSSPAPDLYRWLISGSLGLTLLSVAIIDSVTERKNNELSDRVRVNVRGASGLLILLMGAIGFSMNAGMYLFWVSTLCVLQVFFDMFMAPFEEGNDLNSQATAISELANKVANTGTPPQRRDISEAVRKGTPSTMRKDIYLYLMQGSWTRIFVVIISSYILINVLFAGLYLLDPGSIANSRPNSFADAFFFSVQTMSTIGYGVKAPMTLYSDMIVTVEAAVGILGTALVTGFMFAKVSRPHSSVLFSRPLTVSHWHGKPALIFRIGNARGNEIVDANISFSVLLDDTSPEGIHIRRVHDLKLQRSRAQFFALSWVCIHVIDESSPLRNINWEKEDDRAKISTFLATVLGHDGTYAETIYARHSYYPEDIRYGHRFVDVISQLDDGRLMVDYEHFHDTYSV